MADKYLPELKELTELTDDDLFYFVGDSDYQATLQNLRKVLNPSDDAVGKIVSYNIPILGCYGNWYSNKGALASISFNLPAIQDGIYVGFIVEANKYLNIKPQSTDIIIGMTDYGGQAIRSYSVGSNIVLRATSNYWHVWKSMGTWSKA